ncbi:AraC family transcriptional regulator [Paucibacter soli]|uniref:AraC family transcriptional regulator n=1 Tax=Paucibacter soli TaxID=3133433 RepID=UPI0030A95A9A
MLARTKTTRTEYARLLLPSRAVSGCLFAGILRDTRGCNFDPQDRFNYYPATPMPALHWVFEGDFHQVLPDGDGAQSRLGPRLHRLLVSGPQSLPPASWSQGDAHAMALSFYPDALSQLLGFPVATLKDRVLALHEVVAADNPLLRACETLFAEMPLPDPFERFEALLAPLWSGAQAWRPLPMLSDWINGLASRMAFSSAGRSLRQLQRQIKLRTGQSMRELQLYARVEQAWAHYHREAGMQPMNMAQLAADSGYADQSHMTREVRRVTGMSPSQLMARMRREEPFWAYRLLGEVIASTATPGKGAAVERAWPPGSTAPKGE